MLFNTTVIVIFLVWYHVLQVHKNVTKVKVFTELPGCYKKNDSFLADMESVNLRMHFNQNISIVNDIISYVACNTRHDWQII